MKRFSIVAIARLMVLCVAVTHVSFAQQAESKRKPSGILQSEQAGILLNPGREALEQPERSLDALGLKDGDLIVDMGCGNGYYSLRLATRIAPHGHVMAVDVQQGMLDQLITRMDEAGIRNIYPILGEHDDPGLPPGKADWIFMVDVYHEFSNPAAMLAKIRTSLAPGGRVALYEYRGEQDPATIAFPIPRDHKMTVDEVMSEWIPAGFRLVERHEFLPAQHLFVFEAADPDKTAWHEGVSVYSTELGAIPNVSKFGDHVYFAGQPTADDFRLLKEHGVGTIVNLRSAPEVKGLDFDEAALAKELGIAYEHVPVGREVPSAADLNRIVEALQGAGDAPVLIHCASSNRVGFVWSLLRSKEFGLSADDALAEGKAAGMRAPALVEAAQSYVSSR